MHKLLHKNIMYFIARNMPKKYLLLKSKLELDSLIK